jgi:hypothetical protein
VRSCRRGLARLLNLPQGGSSDVRYIDAALGLQIVTAMVKRDWELPDLPPITKGADVLWEDGGAVYQLLLQRLQQVIDEERTFLQAKVSRITELGGGTSPEELVRASERLREVLQAHSKPHSLDDSPLKAQGFKNAVQHLTSTLVQQARGTTAARMSGGTRYVEQLDAMLRHLTDVEKVATRMIDQTERQIAQLGANSEATRLEEETLALYDEAIELLHEAVAIPAEVQS